MCLRRVLKIVKISSKQHVSRWGAHCRERDACRQGLTRLAARDYYAVSPRQLPGPKRFTMVSKLLSGLSLCSHDDNLSGTSAAIGIATGVVPAWDSLPCAARSVNGNFWAAVNDSHQKPLKFELNVCGCTAMHCSAVHFIALRTGAGLAHTHTLPACQALHKSCCNLGPNFATREEFE